MNETAHNLIELCTVGAASGVALSVCGSLLGIPYEAVLLGMFGALVAESFVAPPATPEPAEVPRWRRLGAILVRVCAAGLFAGLFTRIVETQIGRLFPGAEGAAHVAVAAGLGILAPIAVPLIRNWAQRRAGGGQ